jgi:hypothetical protein
VDLDAEEKDDVRRQNTNMLLGIGAAIFIPAALLDAQTTITQPFDGVRHIHRVDTTPRLNNIHILEIDLAAEGIGFRLTPPNGPSLPAQTTHQTTRDYLIQQNAQAAINASFFYYEPFPYTMNRGLAVSDGNAYSPFDADTRPWPALNITQDNIASIVDRASPQETYQTNPQVDLFNAVSGSERIVTNGLNTAGQVTYGQPTQLHPRTVAGITADNKLVLMTVDGRNTGHSLGMTSIETANLLISYGVVHAINLDGGGSTTMVMADPTPRVVNVPVGVSNEPGTERRNGTNLAMFAGQAPPREPGHQAPHFVNVLEQFDDGYGLFHRPLTYAGQRQNISTISNVAIDTTDSFTDDASQLLQVRRNPADAATWRIRHVSGDANPDNNTKIDVSPGAQDGYIGFFARTTAEGVRVALALDNNGNAAGTMVGGVQHELIADGQWHTYEWNLDDPQHWTTIEGIGGKATIDAGWITVDSIMMYGGNANADIWIDTVAHNPFGSLSLIRDWVPGDANLDGQVNIADLGILASNWQQTGRQVIHGDFNGDGTVDIADLGMLAASWQAGASSISFEEALAMFDTFDGVVVPEPATIGLLCLAGMLLVRRRRGSAS